MLKGGIYITAAVFLFIGFLYMFVIDIDTFDFITNNQIKKAEKIHHINDLAETFPQGCKLAILAISHDVQETVDYLMELGIKGIVDFTHSHFTVNDDVVVQPVDVVVAIQELVLKMRANDE